MSNDSESGTVMGKVAERFQPGGIGRHISWLILHSGVEAGTMTIAVMLAARWFGPADWGQLRILLAGVQLVAMLSDGFYATIVRYVSDARARNSPSASMIGWKYVWITGGIILVVSVVLGITARIAFPTQMSLTWILLAVVLAAGRGWRAAYDGVFRGLQAFRPSALAGMTCSALMAGCIIAAAASGYRIGAYLGIMVVGSLINCLWLALYYRANILVRTHKMERHDETTTAFFRYSLPLALRGLCAFLFLKINVWLLGWLASDFDAGQFGLTDQFLTIPALLLSAVLAAIAPRITNAELNGNQVLTQFLAKVYGLMLLLTIPLAVFFWFNGPLLQWIFPEYKPASEMLVMFAPAMAVQGLGYAASILLIQGGQPTAALLLTLIPSVLNLGAAYVGFRWHGVMGLAMATATLHFLTYLATVIVTHWLFRIPFRVRFS